MRRGSMDEKQLAKLIKRTRAEAEKARKGPPARTYDPTLTRKETSEEDLERRDLFEEMRRREF